MHKRSLLTPLLLLDTYRGLVPPRFTDPTVARRFQEHFLADGLAQTFFAIALMGMGSFFAYLIYGLSGFQDYGGWFEGTQRSRLIRILVIGSFLAITATFWRFWLRHWSYLAVIFVLAVYVLGIVSVKLHMTLAGIPHTVDGGWRSVTTQLMIIFFTFPFIRLHLGFLLVVSIISSITLVLVSFEDATQRMLSGTGLTIGILGGTAVWLNNYRRERKVFERTLALESAVELAKESESLATEFSERHQKLARAVSHDIRQPMAAVGIQMALLKQQQSKAHESALSLAPMVYALEALQSQVEEIARDVYPANHEPPLIVCPVDVSHLVEMAVALHAPLAKEKQITLRVWIGSSMLHRYGQSNLGSLTTILQSLLDNAIKFRRVNPPNLRKFVSVGARCIEGRIVVTVVDNGIGILEGSLSKVFEESYSTASIEGSSTGLGLYNVHRLISVLPDHTVSVSSRRNKYTCFRISLPTTSENTRIVDANPSTFLPRTGQRPHSKVRTKLIPDTRLLLVEDDELVNKNMVELLNSWGATVTSVSSAREAQSAIESTSYSFDIVVCDYELGGFETGLNVISFAREYYDDLIGSVLVTASRIVPANVASDIPVVLKPFAPQTLLEELQKELRRLQSLFTRD